MAPSEPTAGVQSEQNQPPTGMLIYIFIKCHPLDRYRIGTLSD